MTVTPVPGEILGVISWYCCWLGVGGMTCPFLEIEELGVIRLKSISVHKFLQNISEKSFSLELQNLQVGKSNR